MGSKAQRGPGPLSATPSLPCPQALEPLNLSSIKTSSWLKRFVVKMCARTVPWAVGALGHD